MFTDAHRVIVGIDASRNRSGGAKAHLIGLLAEGDPRVVGIETVHLWSYPALLEAVPDQPWLVKHAPSVLQRSLAWQVAWQRYRLPREACRLGCQILLNTDAGTVSTFRPAVTISQDMLSYEPGIIERYGFSKARLRLILLKYLQNRSFKKSDGVIFLTRYASKIIQQSCGPLPLIAYIPHGVGREFQATRRRNLWPAAGERPIRCLYVSNAAPYKHQWVVVQALELLRKKGHSVTLTLVGGGSGWAQRRLDEQIRLSDPERVFTEQLPFVPQADLAHYLANTDLFIFASSCENMPITLIEAMAVGLPIACSNRGPMPEVLEDGGVFFNPEDHGSIADAVEQIIHDSTHRENMASRAKALAGQYSWSRCANETWSFLVETYLRTANEKYYSKDLCELRHGHIRHLDHLR